MYEYNKTANRMTTLLNKIERHLGVAMLPLPESIAKPMWHEVIEEDTIKTFSNYFPYGITVVIDQTCCKDGFYFIDKDLPAGTTILGVRDVDWQSYRCDPRYDRYGINFSTWDFVSRDYCIADVAFQQIAADYMSLFNLGIYPEFLPPNKIKLISVNGSPVSRYRPFPLKILIEHPANLMTISPTMMRPFEKLAQSDIATMLWNNLKFMDGTDTVFATLDLKLDIIQEWYNKHDEIENELKEASVSTANEYQPCIITV